MALVNPLHLITRRLFHRSLLLSHKNPLVSAVSPSLSLSLHGVTMFSYLVVFSPCRACLQPSMGIMGPTRVAARDPLKRTRGN